MSDLTAFFPSRSLLYNVRFGRGCVAISGEKKPSSYVAIHDTCTYLARPGSDWDKTFTESYRIAAPVG